MNNEDIKRLASEVVRDYFEVETLPPNVTNIETGREVEIGVTSSDGNAVLRFRPRPWIEQLTKRWIESNKVPSDEAEESAYSFALHYGAYLYLEALITVLSSDFDLDGVIRSLDQRAQKLYASGGKEWKQLASDLKCLEFYEKVEMLHPLWEASTDFYENHYSGKDFAELKEACGFRVLINDGSIKEKHLDSILKLMAERENSRSKELTPQALAFKHAALESGLNRQRHKVGELLLGYEALKKAYRLGKEIKEGRALNSQKPTPITKQARPRSRAK